MKDKLKVIPLGGLEEIGKNMVAISYRESIIIIDAGMAFPDENMLGVQAIIPNFDYLEENKEKIKGLILTHAHEDHIGAIPYFMNKFDVPIYGTKLTIGLVRNKLRYFKVKNKNNLTTIDDIDKSIILGDFLIQPFRTIHSIFGSLGYFIKTPAGNIVHMGDFKVDFNPVDGKGLNYNMLSEMSEEGVDLLISDSTNALKRGLSNTEREVAKSLKKEMKLATGLTVISTFSSSLPRVQSILDIAEELKKKVIIIGTSMANNVRVAIHLKEMKVSNGTIIPINEFEKHSREDIVLITTGAQGEPTAGLMRLAKDEIEDVNLEQGDTVIFSSGIVPGNEKSVSRLKDKLLKKGVEVIQKEEIHTTGHGHSEDLKMIIDILKPKNLLPFHGEFSMLLRHKQLAEDVGMPPKNIFLMENNDILSLSEGRAIVRKGKQVKPTYVDQTERGFVSEAVARDRMIMSKSGIAVVFIRERGNNVNIDIKLRGVAVNVDVGSLMKKAEKKYKEEFTLNEENIGKRNYRLIKEFSELFSKEAKIRPMIVPFFL